MRFEFLGFYSSGFPLGVSISFGLAAMIEFQDEDRMKKLLICEFVEQSVLSEQISRYLRASRNSENTNSSRKWPRLSDLNANTETLCEFCYFNGLMVRWI